MKLRLDMGGKHSKDPKNIIWTRYNRNIQCDHHVKYGSKIHPEHMSAKGYMQCIQALTFKLLPKPPKSQNEPNQVADKE